MGGWHLVTSRWRLSPGSHLSPSYCWAYTYWWVNFCLFLLIWLNHLIFILLTIPLIIFSFFHFRNILLELIFSIWGSVGNIPKYQSQGWPNNSLKALWTITALHFSVPSCPPPSLPPTCPIITCDVTHQVESFLTQSQWALESPWRSFRWSPKSPSPPKIQNIECLSIFIWWVSGSHQIPKQEHDQRG